MAASCDPDGGMYRYRLYGDGRLEVIQKIPMDRPMYFAHENGLLYAVLRAPFPENADSGILCVQKDGTLMDGISSTKGEVGCHIAVDNGDVYAANYTSGSVIRLPDTLRMHRGCSVHPTRQRAPHAHAVTLSPDKQYVLCCDLGLDQILVYTRDLSPVSAVRTPAGAGPRHLCFSHCGKYVYCVNEMGGSISSYAWEDGVLTLLHTVSMMPPGFGGEGAGAAIKLSADGTRLYATERIFGTIVTLAVDAAELTVLAHTDCHGKEPRDFTLLAQDRFAVCANQFSDSLALYRMSGDAIPEFMYTAPLTAPLCAIEVC